MSYKTLIGIGISSLLLTACHHDNPLQTHAKKENATFLMNASANVEKRLGLPIRKDEGGYGYLECMEGKKNVEVPCKALYQAMVTFAKEGHYEGYQSIRVADLTDSHIFEGLHDDYYDVMVSTWPTYYGKN